MIRHINFEEDISIPLVGKDLASNFEQDLKTKDNLGRGNSNETGKEPAGKGSGLAVLEDGGA